jgi:hypothetical protein
VLEHYTEQRLGRVEALGARERAGEVALRFEIVRSERDRTLEMGRRGREAAGLSRANPGAVRTTSSSNRSAAARSPAR